MKNRKNVNNMSSIEPHVAVLAFPFSTHAAPLLAIVRRLAFASPSTHFSFFNTLHSNNSIFAPIDTNITDNIKPYNVSDGVPEGHQFQLAINPQEPIELFLEATPHNFQEAFMVAVAGTGREITCLITDAFFWFAADLAQDMGVPWLPFWTAGPISLSAHLYTDSIRHWHSTTTHANDEDEPRLKIIPGMSQVVVKDLPDGVVFGNLESIFSRMLHQMGAVLPRATSVLINSFEELDPTITQDLKSKFKKYLNVGPFNLTSPPPPAPDPSGCLSWLDSHKASSVAYIGFGSVVVPSPDELKAVAEGLEASRVAFIWSIKDNSKAHLPEGFIDRTKSQSQGMLVPWAPQREILSHGSVGVFITHCGWNSMLESIERGVPMICRPFFGDQRLNARMVEDVLEVGVKVEGGLLTKPGILKCLDQLLHQDKGKKIRERIQELKQLAIHAVGPKGSSTHNFKSLLELVTSPSTG